MKRIIVTLSIGLSISSFALASSISTQMDNAFNSMVNTTTPKAYNTARRGVISGGGVFVRNETKRANLTSMVPPSIAAGCGGIDLQGGSFSHISADQFIATFQAIGSNALGYGVKLALQSACDSCENIMTSLQKTAEFINKMNVDSCQAAQGIVNAGVDFAAGLNADNTAKTQGILTGGFSDIAEAMNSLNTEGKSATQKGKEDNPANHAKTITGNVAWRAFIDNNVKGIYTNGDNTLLELLMSITGTVIIKDEVGSNSESPVKLVQLSGHQVTLKDLMADSTSSPVKIYKCNNYGADGCLNVNTSLTGSFADKGTKKRFYDAMAGSNGFINSFVNDTDWSAQAKAALGIQSPMASYCIQKIYTAMSNSKDNEPQALMIADKCTTTMAIDSTYAMVLGFIKSVENLITNGNPEFTNPAAKEAIAKILADSKQAYSNEYQELTNQFPSDATVLMLNSLDFTGGKVNGITRE